MTIPRRPYTPTLSIFLIAIAFAPPVAPRADEIYFKDGKRIEGVVRDAGGGEVIVETAGGVFSFKRDSIERIVRGSDLDNMLSKARLEEMRNNYSEAVAIYSDALKLAETERERENILRAQRGAAQKYVEALSRHDPLERGLEDVRQIEQLKTRISDPEILALLQRAKIQRDNAIAQAHFNEGKKHETARNYREAIQHYETVLSNYPEHPVARGLDDKITELYATWGERAYLGGRGSLAEAKEALLESLERSPGHPLSLYYLGLIAYDGQDYDLARDYLNRVNADALSGIQVTRLNNILSRTERRLDPPPRQPVRTLPPPAEPEPRTDPNASYFERAKGWAVGAWEGSVEFANGIMDGSADVMPVALDWLRWLGIGLGVIIAAWYLPMRIVLSDLPRRKVVYHNWRRIVNYTGVLGLLFYFIDRWFREEPRKRCPACNRAVDNPSLFENYEFDRCPYCNTQIKPVFTLKELIQTRAEAIALAKSKGAAANDEAQRQQMLELIQLVMVHGRKARASDIHIEPEESNLLVRYRVDGVLTESVPIPRSLSSFVVSSVKVMCNLNIAEKRLPQDGHFRRLLMGEEVNVRVSTIPTHHGEKVVLRLLDERMVSTTIDRLGMRDECLEQYRKAITAPHGMILATGPTGSGKTTLQYASLQFINDGTKNIVTVEDPIEYELDGINQIQHNTATGLTFATALRSILRQDPDVIMVGEIRDLETATIAVNAALTGHLVFSTLHTIDTSHTLSRLIDIGVDVKMLSSSILCVVAQRLVRKLCPHCKKQGTATAAELKRLGSEGRMLEGQMIYRPRGCRECANTGYIGRTGIYELLAPGRELRELIEKGAATLEIREASCRNGMKTLREEGLLKVLAGVTAVDEVIRVTTEDVFAEGNETAKDPYGNILRLEGKG